MDTEALIKMFKQNLAMLKKELTLYTHEKNLWITDNALSNSAGNLCLHLIGNLNHFIGTILGDTGYVRRRDLEFSLKDVPRARLLKDIDETVIVLEGVLKKLSLEDLKQNFPVVVLNETLTIEYFLTHLLQHFSYHLGQINYHRRLMDV